MKSVILLSTEPYSGKTGLALNMVLELQARGRRAGFFKPVGNLPMVIDSTVVDEDAVFAREALSMYESPLQICPVTLTARETKARLLGGPDGAIDKIKEAYQKIKTGRDALVIEGSSHINDGRLYGVSGVDLAKALDTQAMLVVKLNNPYEIIDDILVLADRLEDRLAGVIFNWVSKTDLPVIEELVVPFLEKQRIYSYGAMPRDDNLLAVSAGDLAEALSGRILCAEKNKGRMIEEFMVGAMGQEQALRFFRGHGNKAVITGGDRTDVQLAALETKTSCLVLTGNYVPPATVLGVAESKEIPVILVNMDTLSAVDIAENLIGKKRVHDQKRLRDMGEKMRKYLDINRLCEAVADRE